MGIERPPIYRLEKIKKFGINFKLLRRASAGLSITKEIKKIRNKFHLTLTFAQTSSFLGETNFFVHFSEK